MIEEKAESQNISQVVIKVAWMAVLLGLLMEVIVLVIQAGFGKSPDIKVIIGDTVQKISWSTFVCVGVAVGITAGKMKPWVSGIAGFIAAPLSFNAAKALHKSMNEALSISAPTAGAVSPVMMASIKALEYGVLGFLLTVLASRKNFNLRTCILTGLAVGIIFGGTVLSLMITKTPTPLPTVTLLIRGVNEILFPVGCSLVVYAANIFGGRLKTISK